MPCRLGQILVFSKIRAALGIMSTIISGGGSLAAHLDDFYEVRLLTSPPKNPLNTQVQGHSHVAWSVCLVFWKPSRQ